MTSSLYHFDLPLIHAELPAFRGAMAALAGHQQDVFHNHSSEEDAGYHHRYPLIQYRVHEGHAAVLGINAGAEALDALHRARAWEQFQLNGRRRPLQVVQSTRDHGTGIQLLPPGVVATYRAYHYLPFSPDKYHAYKAQPSLVHKVQMLERMLTNHLVSFGHGVGQPLPPEQPLQLVLQDIDRVKKVTAMRHTAMAFDLVFSLNATLPEGIAIGRKTSIGFGFVLPLG